MTITGGCLCDAVRYVASAPPTAAGYCCCADCRRASGSGFIPFLHFAADAIAFTGAVHQHVARSARGGDAVRNFCPGCGGLVFGGVIGVDVSHTVYAGSLDDPAHFQPKIAIFAAEKPAWVLLPPGLTVFAGMPG